MSDPLQEEAGFTKALILNPLDRTTRLVYSDWLLERGRDDEAAEQRRRATDIWESACRYFMGMAQELNAARTKRQKQLAADDVPKEARTYLDLMGTVPEEPEWETLLEKYYPHAGEVVGDTQWDWADFWGLYQVYTGREVTFESSDPCGCEYDETYDDEGHCAC